MSFSTAGRFQIQVIRPMEWIRFLGISGAGSTGGGGSWALASALGCALDWGLRAEPMSGASAGKGSSR
ncbi:MAG: hypothetical protein U0271_16810 [Polyangiaceae bacterium]